MRRLQLTECTYTCVDHFGRMWILTVPKELRPFDWCNTDENGIDHIWIRKSWHAMSEMLLDICIDSNGLVGTEDKNYCQWTLKEQGTVTISNS